MIYTTYEMIADFRAGKPDGKRIFIRQYVPVLRRILAHYGATDLLEAALARLFRDESRLMKMEPAPERPFVAELRQAALEQVNAPAPPMELPLEALAKAMEPLTLVEKQVVWLEGMGYSPGETGEMLRMAPPTVEKIRARGADLIRSQVDNWSLRLLPDNGLILGRAAGAGGAKDCLPAKTFLDIVDGRTAWRGRELMEQHVRDCAHCLDHFCRLLEVVELLRGVQPLPEDEAARFDALLGVPAEKKRGWKKWIGA